MGYLAGNYEILYGTHPVLSALKGGRRVVFQVYATEKVAQKYQKELENVEDLLQIKDVRFFENISQNNQGLAAKVSVYKHFNEDDVRYDDARLILALDNIQDPQNLGAIIRNAAAFNVDYIFIPKQSSAQITPAVAKASAGTVEFCKIVKTTNLSHMINIAKKKDFWCVGTSLDAKNTLKDAKKLDKKVVILGSEGKGIRDGLHKNCDMLVKINICKNVESLNVASAAAIMLYELSVLTN